MTKITESEIEKFAVKLLEKHGYQYIYAPSIDPDLSVCDAQAGSDTSTRKIP
ncbi:MAG: hypothetical protein JRJ11_14530 [Deltaproteobacteria bacterium]|nr:hypothetical protein [Deltaproteobacteria bacterium]MBW1910732.1 hypothetical protein [Deltaproteobacteria bacterium]MBW2034058.1 hypothetical protein [Deltaproteobacteria bacterium]